MSLLLNNNVGYSIVGTPTIVDGILSNTDINALISEKSELDKKVAYLNLILSNEKELLKVIKGELKANYHNGILRFANLNKTKIKLD